MESRRGGQCWADVQVPIVDASGWSRIEVRAGLVELERLKRQCAAAEMRLISAMGESRRDAAAAVARATGRSARDAREAVLAAGVAERVPGAADLLERGEVSAGHLAAVASIGDAAAASGLLELAAAQGVDEFRETVAGHRADADGMSQRERQVARRELCFFNGPDGMLGLRGLLPTVEGAIVRSAIEGLVDAAYRRDHPERAATLGGHGAEPFQRRQADALVELARSGGAGAGVSVVVVIDPVRRRAEVVPDQPIPFDEAIALSGCADVYAAIRDHTTWAQMRFGRNRRLASELQRLALVVRDRRCVVRGCGTRATRVHAHHVVDYEVGGPTDVENLALVCPAHHAHLHLHGLRLIKGDSGWDVVHADGTPLDEAWPRAG